MKKFAIILALATSVNAFAQTNDSTARVNVKEMDQSQKGFYVGADYMNLTDVHSKINYKTSYASGSDTSVGGTQLGMAGVTLGYVRTPDRGFGFSGGVRLLEAFNKSEYGEMKLQTIVPEANLTLAMNRLLVGYAGLNAAAFTGSTAATKFQTNLGAQAGLGLRLNSNVAINAGYTMLNQKMTEKSGSDSYDVEFQISGFNTNVVYVF